MAGPAPGVSRPGIGCLLAFLLWCLPFAAFACQCNPVSPDDTTVRNARNVALVRVLATGVSPDAESAVAVGVARVRIVDRLRGKADIRQFLYPASECCGLRIDAGGYYLLFFDSPANVFVAENARLLALLPYERCEGGFCTRWLDILAGKRALDEAMLRASEARLTTIPPPPPPPVPCIPGRRREAH
jgi:hypothetical protein